MNDMYGVPFEEGEPVVKLFATLAHPMRASIVYRLTKSPADVSDLVRWFDVPQPLVSHHLRLLREAHLVQATKDGRRNVYTLVDEHVAHIFLEALDHMREHQHDCQH